MNTLSSTNELPFHIDKHFEKLTGFPLRNFQRETILKILNRQDVLLRAPTGSGKTETAIAPFFFAQELQNYLPQGPNKLIYVVPLRTLANSLRQRAEALVKQWSKVSQASRPLVVTIQTGENPL